MAIIHTGFKGTSLSEIITMLGNKSYDYIEVRLLWKDTNGTEYDEFIGACSYNNTIEDSENRLQSLDGGNYSLNDLYIKWKEFGENEFSDGNNASGRSRIGLTVWCYGELAADS